MHIQAIQTGSVKITEKWRAGQCSGLARIASTMFDRDFTEWLPIYAWVIDHPEGVIVVDTGVSSHINQPGYLPFWHPMFHLATRFDITPAEEIGPQLREMGIRQQDVRWLVMTHLHTDHDGGLHHFPKSEIIVSRAEYEAASGFSGRLNGYLNNHWPEWFAPTLIDFTDRPVGPFPQSQTLTRTGDVHLVPTPGHSAGQLAVIIQQGDHAVFLAGDASYTQDAMLTGTLDGVTMNLDVARQTHERIQQVVMQQPTIYLPSHDPDAERRLIGQSYVPGVVGESSPHPKSLSQPPLRG